MKFYSLVFSPTGGTKKCADAVMSGLCNGEYTEIDLCKLQDDYSKYSFEKEDIVLISVPVFEGTLPTLVVERLSLMHGNSCRAALMAVWGNRAFDDALVCLQDVATKAGFVPFGAVSAVAEHSIVRSIAANRPDTNDVAQLKDFGAKLQEKSTAAEITMPTLPGHIDYAKPKLLGVTPKTSSKCTNCGLCAKECPAGAIDLANCKKVDDTKCISCVRCISVCPVEAKGMPPVLWAGAAAMLKVKAGTPKENTLFA